MEKFQIELNLDLCPNWRQGTNYHWLPTLILGTFNGLHICLLEVFSGILTGVGRVVYAQVASGNLLLVLASCPISYKSWQDTTCISFFLQTDQHSLWRLWQCPWGEWYPEQWYIIGCEGTICSIWNSICCYQTVQPQLQTRFNLISALGVVSTAPPLYI